MSVTQTRESVARRVEQTTGENAYLCYQCQRCSAGCPMAEHFDLLPSEVLRAIQDGDASVARSRTVWLCASCQTCVTRCPQGIDLPAILDRFRQETLDSPSVPEVARFYKVFMRQVKLLGRVYELGLMGELNLREKQPFRDLPMGLRMIRKGKIRLLPEVVRPPRRVPWVGPAPNRVAYYPGCSLHATGRAYDVSFRAAAGALGVDLVEPKGWTCCGTTPAHGTDAFLAVGLPLRNLALVERMGLDRVVAPCAACYGRFKAALAEYREDGGLAVRVDDWMGYEYRDTVTVANALDLLESRCTDDGFEPRRPLHGLKVACYYGCLLTRPARITGAPDPENPTAMERIVRALGAEPVDWSRKTDCCGGSLSVPQVERAKEMTAQVLADAKARGADVVAVACPLCQVNLDERQPEMAGDLGFTLPVVYVTQLLTLAQGLPLAAAALDQSAVDPRPALARAGHA